MTQAYYLFELSNSDEDLKRINLRKARFLEEELKKTGFNLFGGRTGTNGAVTSLLVETGLVEKDGRLDFGSPVKEIEEVMEDLDLPYTLKDVYTTR